MYSIPVLFYCFMCIVVGSMIKKLAPEFEGIIKTVLTGGLFLLSVVFMLRGINCCFIAISVGLLFSTIGDYFLASQENTKNKELFFIIGFLAFLIGYLVYGVTFLIIGHKSFSLLSVCVITIISIFQFFTLDRDLLGKNVIPIFLYFIQASILVVGGIAMFFHFNNLVGLLIMQGCFFLYISDSIIAHNLFRHPFKNSDYLIMPTYYIGQSLLLFSIITSF